jgi:phosphoglycerate kinase
MRKELDYLGRAVGNPAHPYVAVLGGSKISGKIDVIRNLMKNVDALLIGGGMMFTFLKARGLEIGNSLLETDKVDLARQLLDDARKASVKLVIPVDCVVADKFDNNANRKSVSIDEIPQGWSGLDIGMQTVKLFEDVIRKAKMVVWNGPMGVFEMENFAVGTIAIARLLAGVTKEGTTTIIGGGDTAAAVAKAGLEGAYSHVSTGGGASLEFLEGKNLPGVAALTAK